MRYNFPNKGKQCITCRRIGHFTKVCRTGQSQVTPVNAINVGNEALEKEWQEEESDEELYVGAVSEECKHSILCIYVDRK